MKKLSREEIIPLLLNRGTKTYKELSMISGYHEKSIIRISKQIERGKYSSIHGNSGRVPHNKIVFLSLLLKPRAGEGFTISNTRGKIFFSSFAFASR